MHWRQDCNGNKEEEENDNNNNNKHSGEYIDGDVLLVCT